MKTVLVAIGLATSLIMFNTSAHARTPSSCKIHGGTAERQSYEVMPIPGGLIINGVRMHEYVPGIYFNAKLGNFNFQISGYGGLQTTQYAADGIHFLGWGFYTCDPEL